MMELVLGAPAHGVPAVFEAVLLLCQLNNSSTKLQTELSYTKSKFQFLLHTKSIWQERLRDGVLRRGTGLAQSLANVSLEIHAILKQAKMAEKNSKEKWCQFVSSTVLFCQLKQLNRILDSLFLLSTWLDIKRRGRQLQESNSNEYLENYHQNMHYRNLEIDDNDRLSWNETRIGKGSSAEVYRGQLSGFDDVAVKVFTISEEQEQAEEQLRNLEEVIKLHNDCSMHQNVCEIIRYKLTIDESYCVFELMQDSLHNVLHPAPVPDNENVHNALHPAPVPDNNNVDNVVHHPDPVPCDADEIDYSCLLDWMQGIASAVHFLHLLNVVHRDIKPANILVNNKGNSVRIAKLTDFGVAVPRVKEADKDTQQHDKPGGGGYRQPGTLRYQAPEIRRGSCTEPSRKADIYSLGVTLWEIITKTEPTEKEIPKPKRGILGRGYNCREVKDWQEQWNYRVLEKTAFLCVAVDPEKRPEAFQVEMFLKKKILPFTKWDYVSILLLDWVAWHPIITATILMFAGIFVGAIVGTVLYFINRDLQPSPTPFAPSYIPPSASPTNPTYYCFETTDELRRNIVSYLDSNETIRAMYGPIGNWCVEKITDFSYLFCDAEFICDEFRNPHGREFNEDISNWNTTSATNMKFMFAGAVTFDGSSIASWDVTAVTQMSYMLYGASTFNGDITNWNVSNVIEMRSMFHDATSFNRDISKWDTRSVSDMGSLMDGATKFNHNLCAWGNRTYIEELVGNNENMFLGTNCPNTAKPDYNQSPPGPFCYNCDEV